MSSFRFDFNNAYVEFVIDIISNETNSIKLDLF